MVRLFQFEFDIIEERRELAQRIHERERQALQNVGRPGALGEDPNANVYLEELLLETTGLPLNQYDGYIRDAQIVSVNLDESLDFVKEGAYVVLRCFDPEEKDDSLRESVAKYVVAHIGIPELRLLNMSAGLGKILIEREVGLGGIITLPSGVTYKVLELSWGVPVVELERALTKEYRNLHSSLENALRSKRGVDEVRDKIEAKIVQAQLQRQKLVQEYFEKGDEKLPNPFEYIMASPEGRIDIRESTPSQLIHYHRMIDALSKHVSGLNGLIKSD